MRTNINTTMKRIFLTLLIFFLIIPISYSVDFTPTGNINLKNTYNIYNVVNLNGTGNVSMKINASWIQNAPWATSILLGEETTNRLDNDTALLILIQGINSTVNSQTNLTVAIVEANLGNWSADKIYYLNQTQVNELFSSLPNLTLQQIANNIGNWSNDKVNYLLIQDLQWSNVSYRPTYLSNFTNDLGLPTTAVYGNCSVGQVVQNITGNGPQCIDVAVDLSAYFNTTKMIDNSNFTMTYVATSFTQLANTVNMVQSENWLWSGQLSGLYLYETTTLFSPIFINQWYPGYPGASSGSSNIVDIAVQGKYVYALSPTDFYVIDYSNPRQPKTLSSYTFNEGGTAFTMEVSGIYAYVGSNDAGWIEILTIVDPLQPTQEAVISGISNIEGLTQSGEYLYTTTDTNKLIVYNITDPAYPNNLSEVQLISAGGKPYISGSYAYTRSDWLLDTGYLNIIDISDVTNMSLITNFTVGTYCGSLFVNEKYAYTGCGFGPDGLQQIDISNPYLPVNIKSFDVSGINQITAMTIIQNYLLAGTSWQDAGLQIYDIGGTRTETLTTGKVTAQEFLVKQNGKIKGNLDVGSGISVGASGVNSQGIIRTAKYFMGNLDWDYLQSIPAYVKDWTQDIIDANTSMKNYVDNIDYSTKNVNSSQYSNISNLQSLNDTAMILSIGNWSDEKINYALLTYVDTLGNFSSWDKDYSDLINSPTHLTNFTNDLGINSSILGECSDGTVVQNITINGIQCIALPSPSSGGNSSWNQSYADTLYALITEPIASSLGNWSADKASYALQSNVDSRGNWTADKSGINTAISGNLSLAYANDTYGHSIITSSITSIGNWTLDKPSYASNTNVNNNYTNLNNKITSIGNWTADKTSYSTTAVATGFYVNRSLWTSIDNYPAACGAGLAVGTIGDTSTCINPVASSDSTWTLHNSYPAACGAGLFATTIGDTLTCAEALTSTNFTILAGRITSIGNWTSDKPSYATTVSVGNNYTDLNGKIISIGNWTADKGGYASNAAISGNLSLAYANDTYGHSTITASITSIGNWTSDKPSYATNTAVLGNLSLAYSNDTYGHATINSAITSLGNWSLDKSSYALQSYVTSLGNYSSGIASYSTTAAANLLYAPIAEPIAVSRGNWSADKSSYTLLTYTQSLGNWTADKSGYSLLSYVDSLGNYSSGITAYSTTAQANLLYATIEEPIAISLGNWTNDKSLYTLKTYVDSLGNFSSTGVTTTQFTSIGNYTANGLPKAGGTMSGDLNISSSAIVTNGPGRQYWNATSGCWVTLGTTTREENC